MGVNAVQFRLANSAGPANVLGPLESEIMEVIWRRGPSTVSQVHAELRATKEIAYTTVMTTLTRLARKDILDQDKSSPTYLYSAKLDKASFDRYIVSSALATLLADYREFIVDEFIYKLPSLTEAERDKLRAALS